MYNKFFIIIIWELFLMIINILIILKLFFKVIFFYLKLVGV